MSIWNKFIGGMNALIHRGETEQDIEDELRAFLDVSVEHNIRAGMSEAEARRAALLEIGSVESVKDKIRDAGWETWVEAVWADLRYSIRILRKSPAFTAVVVLTLALGIGANTAIFSLINCLILKTLPVERPEELVQISDATFTNPLWEQIRDRQDMLAGAFAWGSEEFNLSNGGLVHNASGFWVSGDLFRTMGLRPAAGRLLTATDDRSGCSALAVLSYNFWQSRYGGNATAVGSVISLNGHPFEVIGVAPAGFYCITVAASSTWPFLSVRRNCSTARDRVSTAAARGGCTLAAV